MATRNPLVLVFGQQRELAAGDTLPPGAILAREKLTAARAYYVRSDGNDSNDGLANSSGGAFLTAQKAVDTVASLDLGIYDATIYLGATTWTAGTTLKTLIGAGQCIIRGINADSSSTIISTTANDCFGGVFVGQYSIQYLKLQTTTSGRGLRAQGAGAVIRFNNLNFGACAQGNMAALVGGYIDATSSTYTISGNAQAHIEANDTANVRISSAAVTLSGTPAFSTAFIFAGRVSSVLAVGTSFSGSATGKRYDVNSNAVITTLGGVTFLPGDTSGTFSNGGVYQ